MQRSFVAPPPYQQAPSEDLHGHPINYHLHDLFHGFWGLGFFRFLLAIISIAALLAAIFAGIAAFRPLPKCPALIAQQPQPQPLQQQQASEVSKNLPTLNVKLAVVGGGIGGVHTAFRAARALPGHVVLLEATDRNCGIIRDIELINSTATKPLRGGTHALRYNLGQMIPIRNLFNEFGIPSYCNGFKSQWQVYGRNGDASYKQKIRSAWNLPNIPFAQYPSDPEYSAMLYFFGAAHGNGVDINPLTGVDDFAAGNHPTQKCGDYKNVYSLYQAYFGDAYANFICSVNVGFLADCYNANDVCGYLDWYQREWNTAENCYPVGGFSEVCLRMRANATHPQNGAKFFQNEPALTIDTIAGGKIRITTAQRIITADQVVLSISPKELSKIGGNLPAQILARPESKSPKSVASVTVGAQYPTAWWRDAGLLSGIDNYRLLQVGGCLTRLEVHNNPYAQAHNFIRVVYTDHQCIDIWKSFIALPEAALRAELARSLKRAFPELDIPEPVKVFGEWEEGAWYYNAAGSEFSPAQVTAWARAPLGTNVPVCLANHAYRVVDSGWSVAAVRTSAQCLNRFLPAEITATALNNWETAYGRITPGWDGETLIPSALANEIFSWNSSTPITWSVPPMSYRTVGAGALSASVSTGSTITDEEGNVIASYRHMQGR